MSSFKPNPSFLDAEPLSRRSFLQKSLAAGAALGSAASLAACGGTSKVAPPVASGAPRRGGTLTAAFSADPAGFDPAIGPSGMSHVVIEQVYSTLVSLDPNNNPYLDLALSHQMSSDGLTHTFKLRQGVKFHNGDPLTSADVQFTFERLLAPHSTYQYQASISTIKRIDTPDPYTVVFHLSAPTAPFLIDMAFPGTSIVPKRLVQSGWDLNAHPIGSGAFKFVSYVPSNSITFTRNPDYYLAGKPYLDGMYWRIIPSTSALTTALVTGEAEFTNVVPPENWKQVQGTANLIAKSVVGSSYNWLLPNNSRTPFTDVRVRQAISYALNRQALVQGAFFGLATPILGGVIPSWSWAYAPDVRFTGPTGDPAKAKALLTKAGHPHGFSTEMTIASSFPNLMAMAPIIQQNLANVGIRTTISTVEIPRYWNVVWGPSNFDITTMYWVSPLVDPDDFLYNNYYCGAAINVQKSCSQTLDHLLVKAKTTLNQATRKVLYREIQALTMQQMPIVPLVNGWLLFAYTNRLRGFVPTRTGLIKNLRAAWLVG